jgi:trk/ktr system potassium uptake protein
MSQRLCSCSGYSLGNVPALRHVFSRMNLFSKDPKRDELRGIPLFAALPRPQFDLLARNADIVEVPAGTELIREGESGREFFAIAEGEVEISQAGRPIATEEKGDVFGEIALLHGIPRTATVTTTAASRLFVVDQRAFRSVLADSFV